MVTETDLLNLSMADAIDIAGQPSDGQEYRTLILRQSTVDLVEPYLVAGARSFGLRLDVEFGGYDTIVQDLIETPEILADKNLVLVWLAPEKCLGALLERYGELSEQARSDAAADVVAHCEQILRLIRERTSATVLWMPFYLRGEPANGLADSGDRTGSQKECLREINRSVGKLLTQAGNAWQVNFEQCREALGQEMFDRIKHYKADIPFTAKGFREISFEVLKFVRNFSGKLKKVLLLDCDNTIWGGIAGELGAESVDLASGTFPGGAHLDLQRFAVSLGNRGVLIGLVSKNDEETVARVFERQDMVLQKQHISVERINWSPKSQNITDIAEELGLGLDSFVFVDDQRTEVEAVREYCPGVSVLELNQQNLVNFASIATRLGWFENLQITETDKARADSYKANRERSKLLNSLDMDSYLQDLGMVATIKRNSGVDLVRAAQISQRTNQFNLTTERLSSGDIETMTKSPEHEVIALNVKDRFGDLGDIGLTILAFDGKAASIENMMLSCRAFGRQCEALMLGVIQRICRERGVETIHAKYLPTRKNKIVEDFLLKSGLEIEAQLDPGYVAGRKLAEVTWPLPTAFALQGGD